MRPDGAQAMTSGMTDNHDSLQRATACGEKLRARGCMLATAESCTGGWLSKVITDVAGSSRWFERGFVTYSNDAKVELLGVRRETLERFGAVSEQAAREMAAGALAHSRAQVAVAITGIAGPEGGTADKPVGLVWIAFAGEDGPPCCERHLFDGDRERIRAAAVRAALDGLAALLR